MRRAAQSEMIQECYFHAQAAALGAKLKGLDPEILGGAFFVEGLQAIFGVEASQAAALSRQCIGYAAEMLHRAEIEKASSSSERVRLQNVYGELATAPGRPAWMAVSEEAVDAVAEKHGGIEG